jgi:hypothetical protein
MPLLVDDLNAMDAFNERTQQRVDELKTSFSHVAESQQAQVVRLQLFTSGSLTFQLEAVTPAPALAPALLQHSMESSCYTSARASPSPLPLLPEHELELELQPPAYRMCRTARTVETLWRERTVGLGGNPSITMLDARWGSRWRTGRRNEVQWSSLRLEIIKEIRRIAQFQRTSKEAAMWQVNLLKRQMECSLYQPCKRLHASRKAQSL